jgi:hypothetical protein
VQAREEWRGKYRIPRGEVEGTSVLCPEQCCRKQQATPQREGSLINVSFRRSAHAEGSDADDPQVRAPSSSRNARSDSHWQPLAKPYPMHHHNHTSLSSFNLGTRVSRGFTTPMGVVWLLFLLIIRQAAEDI